MNTAKLAKVAKVVGASCLLIYMVALESRVQDAQNAVNLLYDTSMCAEPGSTREEVRKCFNQYANYGDYGIYAVPGTQSDVVAPKDGRLKSPFRHYSVEIFYDANGRVVRYQPLSDVFTLL